LRQACPLQPAATWYLVNAATGRSLSRALLVFGARRLGSLRSRPIGFGKAELPSQPCVEASACSLKHTWLLKHARVVICPLPFFSSPCGRGAGDGGRGGVFELALTRFAC
jgi:hypothetical protein